MGRPAGILTTFFVTLVVIAVTISFPRYRNAKLREEAAEEFRKVMEARMNRSASHS